MQKEKNAFEGFTNLYELSKTLRFELKPVGNTPKMLEENKVFEEDKTKQEKYIKIKPYFNRLHLEFVNESLQNSALKFDNYLSVLKEAKENKKDTDKKIKNAREKALQDQEKKLRKEIVSLFDKKAKEYSEKHPDFKKKDVGIFFEKGIFGLLKERYGNEKETQVFDENNQQVSIFDEWKGFTGYFLKFYETRKNFYKSDGTSTAIATRAIDQNLRIFCDNLVIFEKIKNKKDFSEIEKDFDILITDIFSLNYYNKCLLQNGIDKYNKILGGETVEKTGEKKKGINELINEYRQTSGDKIPFLKSLDKQILSEKEKFIEEIENEQEFFDVLQEFHQKADEKIKLLKKLITDFIKNNNAYDLNMVYISKEAFNTISNKWANDVYGFQKAVASELKIKERDGSFPLPNFIALEIIKNALQKSLSGEVIWKSRYYKDEKNENGFLTDKDQIWNQFLMIFNFEFSALFKRKVNRIIEKKENFNEILKNLEKFENILEVSEKNRTITTNIGYDIYKPILEKLINKKYSVDQKSKIVIKNFVDSVLWIYQMGKYFAVEKKRAWNPENLELGDFYSNPDFGYQKFYEDAYDEIVKNYNHLRNYLTKKPWEDNKKWKLNFEKSTLADGWDKNKEADNFAVILRKNGKYFLGLMKKGSNHIFADKNKDKFKGEGYKKMVYKLLPGANKMLPKVFFSKSNINFFAPTEKVLEIRNYSSHSKLGNPQKGYTKKEFNLRDCHILIDFFKSSLIKHEEWKNFNFNFSETSTYKDISGFYKEVEQGGYKISFENISEKYIEEKNQKGELYLFEIHNKDWNLKDGEKKTGAKNLHTLYFENLFSSENESKNFIFKLNGQAELFFRLKTDKNKLKKKKDKNGNEVIDHKRYASDKILFHCPITLNRARNCSDFEFKQKINNFLSNNPKINIIGVDRGEKHLAYYSVINQNSEILEMGSLNEINGVNYAKKLNAIAEERKKARIDWQKVEGIKDLKKGYISQVVRKLADLAIEHNAIIVFEDLNMRFKQIRGGIEKSVYQQLEKALIEKLNFLVKKGEKDSEKEGHLLKAYQLAARFETFQKMGKQTGIIFYTQANYTSITDPVSGFRKNIYVSNTASVEKIKNEIDKFQEIGWDENLKSCYFKYNAKEFNKYEKGESREWTIYADVPRIRREKENGYWKCNSVTPNEMMKELLKLYNFDLKGNIKEQIKNKEEKNELGEKEFDGKKRNFYKSFVYILNLILQVRNSFSERDKDGNEKNYIDFIASPVYPFFTTESKYSKAKFDEFEKIFLSNTKNKEKIKEEFNGDANGAFNIARKGVMILEKIACWQKENEILKKEDKKEKFYPDLFISYSDWDKFVQK